MLRFQSSYRAVSLTAAMARAKVAALPLGISRVTEITRLDRVDVPVFASVRPQACKGSLCVNAGKGMSAREARVGALMEAIEFAFAEPHNSRLKSRSAKAREVLDGWKRPDAILDLCPLLGVGISPDASLPCVAARDLDDKAVLVPAELVFYPFDRGSKQTYFGSSTNGLASGATETEAMVHGLFEVIERDIVSFAYLGRETQLACLASLPQPHRRVIERLAARGFEMAIRWLPNEFNVPCFQATLWEKGVLDPIYISEGYGCHLDPAVALSRALTEAAQSRLTFIHGARDDIEERYAQFAHWTVRGKRAYARRLLAQVRHGTQLFDFRTAPNGAAGVKTLEQLLHHVRSRLARVGISRILRVRLNPPSSTVAVVRVIVPSLEYFTPGAPRVGRRLARYVTDG